MISESLQAFLSSRIDSVSQMEALLMLREQPEQVWVAPQVARRLYVEDDFALTLLRDLTRRKLLLETDEQHFVYRPASSDLAQAVDELAESYRTDLIEISRYIHEQSSPSRRLQSFSDAFRWRKGD